ncbi:unnamed protein product [Anisakis simplex]|uniref:Dizzy (inferred by orthology to a D. melanogaster protein) n=1 Tax=Anisakis simplex TaxID=6269 RepID=A0A158PPL9_ANISI|nr:unnamed protein product [Anisakis simplex]
MLISCDKDVSLPRNRQQSFGPSATSKPDREYPCPKRKYCSFRVVQSNSGVTQLFIPDGTSNSETANFNRSYSSTHNKPNAVPSSSLQRNLRRCKSFGKRSGLNYRRSNDCIVLQHSEMIVVDYPDVKHIHVSHQSTVPSTASHASSATHADISEMRKSIHSMSLDPVPLYNNKTTANNITSTTLSPSSAMRAPSPRKISYPQSHAKTLSEAQAQMKAQTQGSKTYSNSIQCTSNVQKGSQNIPPLPVPPSSRNAVDMSSSSSVGTGSSAVPSTSSQLSVSSRYHNYDNFMNRERDSSRNDCEATVQTHKSQVYLNGLNSAEDATFVRVKHRGRSHKSNSINGGVINMNINVGNQKQRTRVPSTASSSTNDDDLHGLPETAVDSEDEDDESCPSHDSFHELKDCVRECLEKEPSERSADDLAILLDFMQHMSALATLPLSIKRELCMKMVFAIVPDAGTIVMENNEKIDAWSVIVNGQVEVRRPDGQRFEYKLGDCFGAKPVNTVQYHVGEMRTLVDDCEFVLVEHQDYCRIMSRVSEHIHKHSDNITGEIVCETETRSVGSQVGQVLIKGNKEKLIEHLIDERDCGVDVNYADDFLLMHRVFIHDPTMIFEKLMHWFAEATLRDRVARIVLLWANNHFNDFECNTEMMNLLERFEHALERDQMFSQQVRFTSNV